MAPSDATQEEVPGEMQAAADRAPALVDGEEEEEKMCRYCFEGEENGELIAPCKCLGGQKWVHLSCLRRWQRGVLVSQPTHPAFYDDDQRQKICNVCKSEYTCRPPTRLELMQSFTGEELAAMVEERCLIGTHDNFSAELRRQVGAFPPDLHEQIVDLHWIDGAFLIAKVIEDGQDAIQMRICDREDLAAFATALSSEFCYQVRGRNYRLLFEGPLCGAAELEGTEARREAIRRLDAPCTVRMAPMDDGDCGEDGIIAVNLTQPVQISAAPSHLCKKLQFEACVHKALPPGEVLHPPVTHFLGGPCEKDKARFAIVISGPEEYKVYEKLGEAIKAAQALCRKEDQEAPPRKRPRSDAAAENPGGGASASGNNAAGAAIATSSAEADVETRVESSSSSPVRLNVFWGTAGWSRCQLMGEIASGSWGLCKSHAADIAETKPKDLHRSVYPRLVFAPKTEMTDSYNDRAALGEENQMQLRLLHLHRRLLRRQRQAQRQRSVLARLVADAVGSSAPPEEVLQDLTRALEAPGVLQDALQGPLSGAGASDDELDNPDSEVAGEEDEEEESSESESEDSGEEERFSPASADEE